MKQRIITIILTTLSTLPFYGQIVFPTPGNLRTQRGTFTVKDSVSVYADHPTAFYLQFFQNTVLTGRTIQWVKDPREAQVVWTTQASLPTEGYCIDITPKILHVRASHDKGFLYAVQTLRQWVKTDRQQLSFRCVTMQDQPKYPWRGFMLDSGRQFQQVSTIKKYIDMASMLKLNHFHWHLTEGLGWRIEIKQYPLLAKVGSTVGTGPEQQGYYTQEQIRDIVAYAAQRNVTVVPEIDMPGHAEAALAAYPGLSCFGLPVEIPKTGFTHQIFCAGKERVMLFLKNVLDEVCQLFPSEYIHLGGDEAPKDNWDICPDCQKRLRENKLKDSHDLQLWFAAQMSMHLKQRGRKAVFWGDVVYREGYPLPDNTIIQWWNYRGHQELAVHNAWKNGHPVICSPNYYTYLNFPITPWKGYAKSRTFDMQDIYEANPAIKILQSNHPLILGMSCALWTDYEVTESMIDSRLFPRILALAEQMWHAEPVLSFKEFYKRVGQKEQWFNQAGYQYGPALRKQLNHGK